MDTRRTQWLTWMVALLALGGALLWAASRYEVVLRVKQDVPVLLRGDVPLRASIAQRVEIGVAEDLAANVRLGRLDIPLHETLELPLNLALKVPVDSEIAITR